MRPIPLSTHRHSPLYWPMIIFAALMLVVLYVMALMSGQALPPGAGLYLLP